MTHWKKLTNPDYLGSYSLEDGQDLILTIQNVRQEVVTGPEGKKEDCLVCYWKEPVKPMILNVTNAKMIEKLLKTPYIEQWSGKRIQIGSEKVKAFGEIVDALRVRSVLPAEGADPILCEQCGKEITGGWGLSAQETAAYTRDHYKKQLCSACATKEKKAREAAKK